MTSAASPQPPSNGNDYLLETFNRHYTFIQDRAYPLLNTATLCLLHVLKRRHYHQVLDMGCGQGGVGLGLLFHHRAHRLVFLDHQLEFLSMVRLNLLHNGLCDQAGIIRADLLSADRLFTPHCFDLVCLNPPFYPPGQGKSPRDPFRRRSFIAPQADFLSRTCRAVLPILRPKSYFYLIYPVAFLAQSIYILENSSLRPTNLVFFCQNETRQPRYVVIESRPYVRSPLGVEFLTPADLSIKESHDVR
ncbi:MAG: methyltransferase [Candidatus Delongbacteria bacterium]|nr:methyltransferase [Candidatus Delongbacteria bacterium]